MSRLTLAAILLTLAISPLAHVAAQDLLWVRQAGTAQSESGTGVAVDGAGNAYITGYSSGNLGGTNVGNIDAFLAKYDAAGTLLWTRQIGTTANDYSRGVAVDGSGNAYITGHTNGSLGGPNAGSLDAFLAKYDASGTLLWTRQTGTGANEDARGVAVDSAGNAYLTGYTNGSLGGANAGLEDAFLAKYDTSGTLLWTRQTGTASSDEGYGVAVDRAGNAYITGYTHGNLGGPSAGGNDAFLTKYDALGTRLWARQIGSPAYDYATGVAVDRTGNAYVTGWTLGSLGGPQAGLGDAFLLKFDASGDLLWKRQTGTTVGDVGRGVAVDSAGSVYITGETQGDLGGLSAGSTDIFLTKYEAWGLPLWTRQIGTPTLEYGFSLAVDGAGGVYIAGYTTGSLGGPSEGSNDYYLAKFGPPPCPADFNHDGFVTGDDFDSFSLAFIAGDAAADFDGDGFVTGDDFDAYVAAFEAGC